MEAFNINEDTILLDLDTDIMGEEIVQLQTKLTELLNDSKIKNIVIDFQKVKYALSGIVPIFEETNKEISEKNGKLILKNVCERIKDLFATLSNETFLFE